MYYVAMEVTNVRFVPEGMVSFTVPAQQYAVHTFDGLTDDFLSSNNTYYSAGNAWMRDQGYEALIQQGLPWFEEFDLPEFAPGMHVRFQSNVPVYSLK